MGFKPRKGDAPATGKLRPSSNFERTMALASQIAAESLPDEYTVSANEQAPAVVAPGVMSAPPSPALASEGAEWTGAREAAVPAQQRVEPAVPTGASSPAGSSARDAEHVGAASATGARASAGSSDGAPGTRLSTMRIDMIRLSPFQPKGRPSQDAVNAVRRGIERAGSVAGLVGIEGHTTFQGLSAEAKRLAELAYSISRDGVRDPIEVRTAEDGEVEALSGHRRIAAAALVARSDVPVLHRGPLTAVQAAATVLSGNLHRENFTPWQEAVLVTEVMAQRRADSLPADVRTIGAIMGYSHGRVSTLQTIRRVLSADLLARVGDLVLVEEALARFANYSRLEEVARMADDARREATLRRLLGIPGATTAVGAEPEVDKAFEHRPKRRGGFLIEVHRAIEEMAPRDASTLRELFAAQVARLDARLKTLGHD